jgi:Flp pilus assembly protein TadG
MLHSRRAGDRERGQILVLFELVLIVILACAAIVIDLGVLRNNRQILVNTFDAAALAGGTYLPVDGSASPTGTSPGSQYTLANALITATIKADYPGLTASNYTITYKCLIGADATGPLISRDVPSTCDPRRSLGIPIHNPLQASDITSLASHFTGAGVTRVSSCDPTLLDKCNGSS